MKGIRFALLYCGYVENDMAWNYAGYNFGTSSDRNKPREFGKFPSYCVLIEHPEAGRILYDVGPGLGDDTTRRPADIIERFPLIITREQYVDKGLEKLGLSVDDIDMIVLSHTHWDHMGGLEFFVGTKAAQNVLVPFPDFQHGLAETHQNPEGRSTAYVKKNYEIPGITYTFVENDLKLASGLELYLMNGHTPGVLSLLIETEHDKWLFTSDVVYSKRNYGPPVELPGLVYDTLGQIKSTERLRRIANECGAHVIFPHDMEQLESMELAPHFYA